MQLTGQELSLIKSSPINGANSPDDFVKSFEVARELTRKHAKSFYFSSIALPERKKRAAYAVYAFCRYADDLIDKAVEEKKDLSGAEASLSNLLDELYAGTAQIPWAPAFWLTVEQFCIPKVYFSDLMKGVLLDRGPVRIKDWEELHQYCYYVASVVGLMMSKIFELSDPAAQKQAIEMGVAMQLTNILRDIHEDYLNNRIYLPASELSVFAYSEEQIAQGMINDDFISMMKFQIGRTREYYRSAEPGILKLANDGSQLTVWIMSTVYSGILDEIEKVDYNIYAGRVHTSGVRKLFLLLKSWWRWRQSQGGMK